MFTCVYVCTIGMVSHKEVLYVAETMFGSILAFNIYNEQFLSVIVQSNLVTAIEQIMLSPC
jgi:hypothetical protein